mmetsp:Transcript_23316/g.52971  ORF Transcript_23316/g.52971 Transcript_23316/m.52971 type:complete len:230 (-) Transcript_23316:369-1058(-)
MDPTPAVGGPREHARGGAERSARCKRVAAKATPSAPQRQAPAAYQRDGVGPRHAPGADRAHRADSEDPCGGRPAYRAAGGYHASALFRRRQAGRPLQPPLHECWHPQRTGVLSRRAPGRDGRVHGDMRHARDAGGAGRAGVASDGPRAVGSGLAAPPLLSQLQHPRSPAQRGCHYWHARHSCGGIPRASGSGRPIAAGKQGGNRGGLRNPDPGPAGSDAHGVREHPSGR